MTCKYVSEFEFPTEAGFSGSAGKTMVKGYSRGGKTMCGGGKYAKGGKSRAKQALKNEREEMARVERETRSERRDADSEMKRVRREERVDMAKLSNKPSRKRYPTDRSEPLIKASRGGKM